MTILADENIDGVLVNLLREAGHTVKWIAQSSPGVADDVVLASSVSELSLLITKDKDFGDLIFNHYQNASSVLLLRLKKISLQDRAEMILDIVENHADELLGNYSVLTNNKLRIRPLH